MFQSITTIKLLSFCLFGIGIHLANAQGLPAPTPAQIQQFKSLSPAQQQQMAEAAGIDLGSLGAGNKSTQPDLSESNQGSKDNDGAPDELNNEDDQDDPEESSSKQKDPNSLPLFGRDLFHKNINAFRPASNIPVPADYVMGPGDTIVIQLYGKENAAHSLVVNREGQIQFPQIGPVNLAGLTFNKAQEVIKNIVSEQMIGVKASITMGTLRTIRVFVLGEVQRPGSFTIGSLSTMTNALFESGGITGVGSLRSVQLKRQGEIVNRLDLYNLLLKGDTSQDVRLLPGDVIFVPPIGKTVSISGAIKRPAKYEVQGDTTAADLIKLAGGLRNTAYLPISYLLRLDEFGEKTLINVDLSNRSGKQFQLQDGDLLSIASSLNLINNQITLQGHIKRPGPRSWKPNMRFTDVINSAFELMPNPDIEMALIQRFSPSTRRAEVILFSPREAWAAPKSKHDPHLQGYDVVYIFNFEKDRSAQLQEVVAQLKSQSRFNERSKVVNITGSVKFPGEYPLANDMSSEDLIHLAGGLSESAFGINGEITRYDIDENLQRVVMHLNLDLTAAPVALNAGDTLRIKQIPLWKKRETVEISGEVMFPGNYTILPGESLLDVLTRAGGLTPHAFPLGAIFSREELRNLEQKRLQELKDKLQSEIAAQATSETVGKEALDAQEAEMLMKNLDNVTPLGRMVINLPEILDNPENKDFQMEDGDILTIPRYKPSVTVVGEVQYPTSHFYDESIDVNTYIDRSGGLKKQADKRRIYIVKANGSVMQPEASAWFRAKREHIEPGDTIVVPLETDKVDGLTVWSKATQIIYQTALGAAAIGSL